MRTTGNELRSEAAIYAEGTAYTTDDLVREYTIYADECEQADCLDFQRWAEQEGYGTGGTHMRPHHHRMYAYSGTGEPLDMEQHAGRDDAEHAAHRAMRDERNAATVTVEAWHDDQGEDVRELLRWEWHHDAGEWRSVAPEVAS